MNNDVERERCDNRRRLAHLLARFVRTVTLIGLCGVTTIQLGNHPVVFETGLRFGSALLVTTALILLVSFACQLVTYITVAALLTRTRNVRWLSIRQCNGLFSWIGSEWSYYNDGWQRGYRCLGLDVVTSGRLN